MKKGSLMFILGSLIGAGAAYVATTRKEEILQKIEELQEQVKESDLPERARTLVKEISESIKNLLLTGEETMSEEERKSILEEVEAKIRKLEEAIQKSE
ncbi:MAG: YtxH domain-containing protein [Desulfurobacteriaceae bacterium]